MRHVRNCQQWKLSVEFVADFVSWRNDAIAYTPSFAGRTKGLGGLQRWKERLYLTYVPSPMVVVATKYVLNTHFISSSVAAVIINDETDVE